MDPTTPEVKIADAALFTKEAPTSRRSFLTPEQQARNQKRREARDKGASGKDILGEIRDSAQEVRFSSADEYGLLMQFAGDKAVENPGPPPTVDIDSTATPQEKINFENRKQRIEDANALVQYAKILAEAGQRGQSIDVVMKDRVAKGEVGIENMGSYFRARGRALDALIANPATRRLYPELDSITSLAAKRDFIETFLAKDPAMRNKVAQTLKEIAEEAQSLPEIVRDTELKEAEGKKKALENGLQTKIDQTIGSIEADGFKLNDDQKREIERLSKTGATPDQIINHIRSLTVNQVPNAQEFAKIPDLKAQVDEAYRRYQEMKPASTTTKNATPNPAADAAAKGFQEKFEKLSEEYQKLVDLTNSNRADFDRYTYLNNRYSLSSSDTSTTGARFSEISDITTQLNEVDRIIAEKKANPNKAEKASILLRQRKEADLQDRLDNIFTEATLETVEKRYDEVVLLEQKLHEEEVKKTGTEDDKAVLKGMENRWISFDRSSRKKDTDHDRIRQDMRMLAYEGDDGIKRLMLRELNFLVPRLDASGNPVLDAGGQPLMEAIDYNSVDLSTLSDEHKKRLDDVYARHGNALRDKLFKDSFMARTRIDRLKDSLPGGEKMGLADHEWQMLEEKFSGKLAEAIAGSSQAQGAIKNLEAQGIKPNFKMKWLLYVMLGLGLAVPAIGIGGAAIGVLSRR